MRGQIILVCDATVADRYIGLEITDGTNITERLGISTVIVASETKKLDIGEARVALNFTLGNDFYLGIDELILEGADQLRISIFAGVAGDSYSGYIVVREL